jgi:hypothetical protein
MTKWRCIFLSSVFALAGCGGPLGNWKLESSTVGSVNSGTGRPYQTVVHDGEAYQIECSGAHPAYCWPVGPNRLGAIMNNVTDNMSYETIHALEGNRYRFLRECEGEVTKTLHGGETEVISGVTLRVLEYTDQTTVYVLRDVDMNGRKFRDYMVVASRRLPAGNYVHWIEQRTNKLEEVAYCRE